MVFLLCLYGLGVLCFGNRPITALFNPEKAALLHTQDELYIIETDVREDYLKAVNYLAKQRPQSLGIIAVDNNLEYPLWRLLEEKMGYLPTIVHLQSLPDAGGPAYIWAQEEGERTSFKPPCIFKKTATGYIQIFPERHNG